MKMKWIMGSSKVKHITLLFKTPLSRNHSFSARDFAFHCVHWFQYKTLFLLINFWLTATYHHLLFKFFIDIGMFTFVYLLICSHTLINVLVCFLIYNSKKKKNQIGLSDTSKIASNNLFLSVTRSLKAKKLRAVLINITPVSCYRGFSMPIPTITTTYDVT